MTRSSGFAVVSVVSTAVFLAACQGGGGGAPASAPASPLGVQVPTPPVDVKNEANAASLRDAINSAQFFALQGENSIAGPGQIVAVRFDQRNLEVMISRRALEARYATIETAEACNPAASTPPSRPLGNRTVDRQLNARGNAGATIRQLVTARLNASGNRAAQVSAVSAARAGYTLEEIQAIRASALARPACVAAIQQYLANPAYGMVCVVKAVMTADFTVRSARGFQGEFDAQTVQLPVSVPASGQLTVALNRSGANEFRGSGIIGATLAPQCWAARAA